MAITKVALLVSRKGWALNAYTADASGCEELQAAPTAGSLYLTQISVLCADKITVTIGAGETASAVTTVILGPLTFNTEVTAAGYMVGTQYNITFLDPIKLAATTSLTVDASGAGAVQVFAAGYTE